MFNNPGQKIKTLAIISFWVTFVGSVIAGIVLIASDYVPIGLPLLLGGFFVAYVEALLFYGFGELIEKTCDIERRSTQTTDNTPSSPLVEQIKKPVVPPVPQKQVYTDQVSRPVKATEWKCTCGRIHQRYDSSCICGVTKQEALFGKLSSSNEK